MEIEVIWPGISMLLMKMQLRLPLIKHIKEVQVRDEEFQKMKNNIGDRKR